MMDAVGAGIAAREATRERAKRGGYKRMSIKVPTPSKARAPAGLGK